MSSSSSADTLASFRRQAKSSPREKSPMKRSLMFSAIAFAILWTGGMYLLEAPEGPAGIIGLAFAGLFAGLLWYLAMSWPMAAGRADTPSRPARRPVASENV
jgi:hypothetical protein